VIERDAIRVDRSPSHCPFCKGELGDLRAIVACAPCGARHHADCRYDNGGRCATCGGAQWLEPSAGRVSSSPAPVAPFTGSGGSSPEARAAETESREKPIEFNFVERILVRGLGVLLGLAVLLVALIGLFGICIIFFRL
jgi:hypothetical protein